MRPYEDVLYDDYPFPLAHPHRLRAVGTLFGLTPPSSAARVLDLGCGLGGHIIASAAVDPDGEYLGLDLSEAQVAAGQRTIDAVGLDNVRLQVADLADLPADLGRFDVIICHGVYSWVPEAARRGIWAACRKYLAPGGIALVSANMNPGWLSRRTIRHTLLRLLPPDASLSTAQRVRKARQILERWTAAVSHNPDSSVVALLDDLLDIQSRSDAYLLYEHLAPVNDAFWFDELHGRASAGGLQYICDALMRVNFPDLPESVEEYIAAEHPDPVRAEAVRDGLCGRLFRRSLWTHRGLALDRAVHWRRLQGLWLTTQLRADPDRPGQWRTPSGTTVEPGSDLTARALDHLSEASPGALPFDELCDLAAQGTATTAQKARIGESLLDLFWPNLVQIRSRYPAIATAVPERPVATPLARHQAAYAEGVVNLLHRRYALKRTHRRVLQRLDGSRTVADLVPELRQDALDGEISIQLNDEVRTDETAVALVVNMVLDHLQRDGFLLAP